MRLQECRSLSFIKKESEKKRTKILAEVDQSATDSKSGKKYSKITRDSCKSSQICSNSEEEEKKIDKFQRFQGKFFLRIRKRQKPSKGPKDPKFG